MRVLPFTLPSGDAGIRALVGKMKGFARAGKINPEVRDLALQITGGLPGRDGYGQAHSIREWLTRHVAFTRDPDGTELLYTPARMLKILRKRGPPLRMDCDDVAVLAAALGGSIGLKSRFVVVGFLSPKAPFRHVWTELRSPSQRGAKWLEMDTTRLQQSLPIDKAISRRWTVDV